MNRTRSLTLLALAALSVLALARAGRSARSSRRVADARLPDRATLERPPAHRENLDTYQDLLDESLQLTFPASDPICAQAATRCGEALASAANATDWRLHLGSAKRSDGPGAD